MPNKSQVGRYKENPKRNIENVTARRKALKQRAIEYKGSKCHLCEYSKCNDVLEFHHIDPLTKLFGLSISNLNKSWIKIKAELDKCVLLCANCH